MQIPTLIETTDERMLDVIVMKSPGPMDNCAVFVNLVLRQLLSFSSTTWSDRHDVGRAIREPDAGSGKRDLHHVLREIARRMHHVLVRRGNAAASRVVVGAEVRRNTTATSSLQK